MDLMFFFIYHEKACGNLNRKNQWHIKIRKILARLLLAINSLEKYNNKNKTRGWICMRTKTRQLRNETSLRSLANSF